MVPVAEGRGDDSYDRCLTVEVMKWDGLYSSEASLASSSIQHHKAA